jgi:hypothetical protein
MDDLHCSLQKWLLSGECSNGAGPSLGNCSVLLKHAGRAPSLIGVPGFGEDLGTISSCFPQFSLLGSHAICSSALFLI